MKNSAENGINSADDVHVMRVKRLDEDETIGKKQDPLDVQFTDKPKEKGPEPPPPVGFFKLFRFSTTFERLLMLVAVLSTVVSAACQPLNTLFFGTLTGVMVEYAAQMGGVVARALDDYLQGRCAPEDTVNDVVLRAMFDPNEVIASGQTREDASVAFLDGIRQYSVRVASLGGIMFVATYISITLFNYVATRQIYRIRDIYLKSVLQQDIGWYDMHQSGDFASRMAEDLLKLEEGMGEKVAMFLHLLLGFVGSLVLALVKGWELALICLISLPITMIALVTINIVSSRLARRELEEYAKAGSIASEVLGAVRTVIAFSGQATEAERYEKNLVSAKNINIKRSFFTALGFGVLWFCIYSSYALAFYYGVGLVIKEIGWNYEDKVYTPATMITVFFSVMMGSMMFGMASPYIEAFSIAKGAAAKVYSVVDRVSPINSMSEEGDRLKEVNGNVSFKNVHFEYPSRKGVKILRGLNLTINRGETVALVGGSGCGKSTCIQLVQRFYDPLQGSVELDGHDIRKLNVGWLRSQIGVVGQEPVLFQTSIAENIRYGRDGSTMEEIIEAAKMANAHDFISKLPQGYDTLVGERGAQLSGGQKQRIAIARALVRRPKILLLDEATSALDTGSEAKVQAALDKASVGRTTIIVAHRLSTIRNADRIVVISGGSVVEEGPHDALMALQGHYHNLVTTQVTDSEDTSKSPNESADASRVRPERLLSVRSDASSAAGEEEAEEQEMNPALRAAAERYAEQPPQPVGVLEVMRLNSPEWPQLAIGTVFSIVAGCAMPVFAVLFGDVIGTLSLQDGDQMRKDTNRYCVLFVIVGVVIGCSYFLQIFMYGIAGEKLTMRVRSLMFSAMLRQEVAWFDDKNNSTGALCARLSGDAASVQGATGQRIGSIVQSLSTLVLAVGLAVYYEWRLGLVAVSFTPFMLAAQVMQRKLVRGETLGQADAMEKAIKLAVEAVGNIRTVAGLCKERYFHQQYMLELRPSYRLARRNVHVRGVVFGLSRSIGFFAYSACMFYGGSLVESEGLPYKDVFKVSQSLIMGTTVVANALSFAPNLQKGIDAAANVFHLLRREPRITDPANPSKEMRETRGEVQYESVEFAYPTRLTTMVLRGLRMEVRPGQTVALVGPSGCGKSTCIQLLERFYDPISGIVSMDGRDVSSILMSELRAPLGIVSQEPVLFDRTVAENIAYGDNTKTVSMAEIIEAAKKSNIHNFIASLPQGYDTRMGEKGTQLSGGQKQRVAIARALVRNPKILLLDEATSALDAESEKVVQEALDKAKEGRTCITIAHRLSTIQDADVICVINEGRVAELGKHTELLERRGIYHKLHSLQSGRR
ncbi:ATP-dependent translocase ABCB1-like [Schistocerca nitens]|uniref:ATP-dependent translocase ABCB1-like n=1 Tax=Schistocerca nitens TaxID=7011 RepID=UPI0021186817|nr:ATP-dependent translocase ABCB1-like [Schistocerca nitens]